ncbi:mitogen-activated protein kinase kinase kinase 4-like isoform X2 [Manduca sexta]|uniref:mitogen-activated protein kinase kinase kinase 4-like isoform X2 n=1 Tax=Manduca sexta TaxID=7130 RepID=UPI00188E9CBB|nr:mitogen-activated protein kinase kinase kinase 4-like isoform X2 [Manduca sexta]
MDGVNLRKKTRIPAMYDSEDSSDDIDTRDVIVRHSRSSSKALLADAGDGAEADLLGTTPPRSRIRNKEKRKNLIDCGMTSYGVGATRTFRERKDPMDFTSPSQMPPVAERLKKRASLKLIRSKERDWKQQDSSQREIKETPPAAPAVATLVESCSRFMSLTSRPKSVVPDALEAEVEERRPDRDKELPEDRVNFHNTFCMLINMGNIDRGCKRTISREEKVWQNELKDLIWLELQARCSGRTLAQQDMYLCSERKLVPALINNIMEYQFVNTNPCQSESKLHFMGHHDDLIDEDKCAAEDQNAGCLEFDCQQCSEAIGAAMRDVYSLLEAFNNAVALYPSSKAMMADHPQIATKAFDNRVKTMCLWFNLALNMRLKMASMRAMLRALRLKTERSHARTAEMRRQPSDPPRECQVRFTTPTDSSGSDLSAQSDVTKEEDKDSDHKEGSEASEMRDISKYKRDEDEVDSGVESTRTNEAATTPEIVVSCSASEHSEAEWAESRTREPACLHGDGFDLGPLHDITQLQLLDRCRVSVYREHHREILKTQSVRRCMMFIAKMKKHILSKVHLTLEKPDNLSSDVYSEDENVVFGDDDENEESLQDESAKEAYELRRYGCWSKEHIAMRLPSYRSHFLLLSSICMEAVHDYLSFRLETRPENPSCLTVKQLIHELKEGLDISSDMRLEWVRNVEASVADARALQPRHVRHLRTLLSTFDHTAGDVLKQYLSYLRMMSETEQLARSWLQAEWEFTARLAQRTCSAASLAPQAFTDIACNQLNRVHKSLQKKFEELLDVESVEADSTSRHTVFAACRLAQSIYAGEREAALQAAQWARALAARLARLAAHAPHAHLAMRQQIFESLMTVRDFVVKNVHEILKKSDAPVTDEYFKELDESVSGRVRELLLQVFKVGFELDKELYKYVRAPFSAYEERESRRRRPASLQPPRPPPVSRRRRPDTVLLHESFNPMIHKELQRFVNDAPLSRPSVTTNATRSHWAKLIRSESVVEENEVNVFDALNNFGENQTQSRIEALLVGVRAPAPADSHASAGDARVSGEERQWAARVARAVIEFARCWMDFVVRRCDRGRGTRPRWASQGLEFLTLACDPCNTKHLSEEEFKELKQLMDGCISHVIGSRPPPAKSPEGPAPSPRPRHRLHSPLPSSSSLKDVSTPPTPPGEREPSLVFLERDPSSYQRRVLSAVSRIEQRRERQLVENKRVGRVLEPAVTPYEPKLRQLTFKWQRGLKIGAGAFGKVYTVVNTESGQLLAMKELSVGAGDRRALQRAANELRVLEGVVHPHLVRYYGCELHREELLLFMELCVEGSLEALVCASGALPEPAARRYTKQLVSALHALHARNIAHRDVKSGNIFLTNDGHCLKLGDFGCAVKIRANTTAPHELQGFVGTQAYMAPEVFMKNSHGRAADIWSLGCVVTEMASGKRPFPEYDNYQIMFKVGMGGRPEIPDTLSEEGQQFCESCLTHESDQRPTAAALSLHSFLMVKSDDDCQCDPGHLIS